MIDLQKTAIGTLTKDDGVSKTDDITSYVNSIISAETVALGGGIPNINDKATNYGIAIGLSASSYSDSVVIGVKAKDQDISHSNVVAIGAYSTANNWGVAVGTNAYADYGTAIGTDTRAEENTSLALGRYAQVSAEFATQINGNSAKSIVNKDKGTLKFYTGTNNVTLVNSDGKISADVAASCDGKANTAGTADNANALNDGASLGTTIKIGDTLYTIGTTAIVDASSETKTVLTLTPTV